LCHQQAVTQLILHIIFCALTAHRHPTESIARLAGGECYHEKKIYAVLVTNQRVCVVF
jgi:hypothetical protein